MCPTACAAAKMWFRQSDLSNCSTRLDVDLSKELAVLFGVRLEHSELLCPQRPAIMKAGGAVGKWIVPERGMAQGDPVSPLAAALFAAWLTAALSHHVDDGTWTTTSLDEIEKAFQLPLGASQAQRPAEGPEQG